MFERFLYSASVALMLLCSCGREPDVIFPGVENSTVVTGRVYPSIASVRIYLLGAEGIDSTTLNSTTGIFSFTGIPYGTYYLEVKAPGYGAQRKTIHADQQVISLSPFTLDESPFLIGNVEPVSGTSIDSVYFTNHQTSVYDSVVSIEFRFTEPMDTASVCSALVVTPGQRGLVFDWSREATTLIVRIPVELSEDEFQLSLTIEESAQSRYGTLFEVPLYLTYPVDSSFFRVVPLDPLIVKTVPGHGEKGVEAAAVVEVLFDSVMNEMSVEEALSVAPETDFFTSWEVIGNGHALRMVFTGELLHETGYTVSLDSGWMTTDRSAVGGAVELKFTTAPPQIKVLSPRDGQSNVAPDEPIRFITNFNVTEERFRDAFAIDPLPDSLRFEFDSVTQVITIRHRLFDSATVYTVSIDSSLQTENKKSTGKTLAFTFETVDPDNFPDSRSTVGWSCSITDGQTDVAVNRVFSLLFNQKMDTAAVESLLTITPPVSYYSEWKALPAGEEDTLYRFEIHPRHSLAGGMVYTVTIDSGCTIAAEAENNGIRISFTTATMQMVAHSPAMGQSNVDTEEAVALSFSTPVDKESLVGSISAQPECGGWIIDTVVTDTEAAKWTYYLSHDPFDPLEQYTITVDTTVTDLFGSLLGKAVQFGFSTGN